MKVAKGKNKKGGSGLFKLRGSYTFSALTPPRVFIPPKVGVSTTRKREKGFILGCLCPLRPFVSTPSNSFYYFVEDALIQDHYASGSRRPKIKPALVRRCRHTSAYIQSRGGPAFYPAGY